MSTDFPTKNGINRQWHLIDAQDVVLGKLASKAAMVLMGKTKPIYTPFIDSLPRESPTAVHHSPNCLPHRRHQNEPTRTRFDDTVDTRT